MNHCRTLRDLEAQVAEKVTGFFGAFSPPPGAVAKCGASCPPSSRVKVARLSGAHGRACTQTTPPARLASLWMNDTGRSPGVVIAFVLTLDAYELGLPFALFVHDGSRILFRKRKPLLFSSEGHIDSSTVFTGKTPGDRYRSIPSLQPASIMLYPKTADRVPVLCLRAFRREPTPSFPLADDRWVSRRTAREGAVGGIRGWDSDPFLKCICACQLHEQFENHGLIYLIQYVGLKCDTFLFLFEPF